MGVNLWLTVPTAGRDTLTDALAHTGIPPVQTVIVTTARGVKVSREYHVLADRGPINIHRWWNKGIDYAQANGATHVAVINDDAVLGDMTLKTLCAQLVITGATIASPGLPMHVTDPDPHRRRTINGGCWVLDLASGLRPDERYRWWYGDDDLDLRARRDHGGVLTAPVPFINMHANEQTFARPDLQALAVADRERWNARLVF